MPAREKIAQYRGATAATFCRRYVPPLTAFIFVRFVLFAAAAATGVKYWSAESWGRADTGHYLWIAHDGYVLHPCSEEGGDPSLWCGNAGWMPAYSYLLAPFARNGYPADLIGAILSGLFAFAVLVLVWHHLLHSELSVRSFLCLLIAAVFPGAVYQHAIFPISLFLLCSLTCIIFLARRIYGGAALAGAAAALTYSTGFLLAGVCALWILVFAPEERSRRWRLALAVGVIIAMGFVSVLAWQQVKLGTWEGFFRVQGKYGHGWHNPLSTLRAHLHWLWDSFNWRKSAVAEQTAFVLSLMMASAATVIFERNHLRSIEVIALIYALSFWAFPLLMGPSVSPFRAEALLMPLVVVLRRLPLAALAVTLAASTYIACVLTMSFFDRLIM